MLSLEFGFLARWLCVFASLRALRSLRFQLIAIPTPGNSKPHLRRAPVTHGNELRFLLRRDEGWECGQTVISPQQKPR